MPTQLEGDLHDRLKKIMEMEKQGEIMVTKDLPKGTVEYKVQDGYFEGNGVFFNPKSNNRFSLSDKSKWPMYVADSPHTALKESFQGEGFIDRSDFENSYMAEIQLEKDVKVIDLKLLAQHLNYPIGDLMAPKCVYEITQALAKEMSDYAIGCEYLSRHTGASCTVFWSDKAEGDGSLSTISVTPLKEYEHKGKTAKQILKSECNIQVTG